MDSAKARPLPPVAVSPRLFAIRSAPLAPHSRPRRSPPAAIRNRFFGGRGRNPMTRSYETPARNHGLVGFFPQDWDHKMEVFNMTGRWE